VAGRADRRDVADLSSRRQDPHLSAMRLTMLSPGPVAGPTRPP
jgi:hypothetical protein